MLDVPHRLAVALTDRYRFERELGRGGMATVYLAEDLKHSRHVAIKVLLPELSSSLGSERFLREITLAAKLNHPHILTLYDSGEVDGLLYYVMPYVQGESLRDRLERDGPLPTDDAIAIVREVADALSHAHAAGVIHRDIKPDNILLSGGHAVVSDFGIARAVDAAGGERLTATGLAIGTPAYMSPEQASGARAVDARSDTYSLACVAYEMLGGTPPFSGPTIQAVLARHAVDPVPSLRTIRPALAPEVDRVLAKALAKVPADRFTTPAAFVEALQRALAMPAEHSRRPTDLVRWWRARSLTARTVAALVGVGALVALGSVTWRTIGGTSTPASIAVLPFSNLSRDSTQEYFVDGMQDALIGELGRLSALHVTSRTSTLRFKATNKSRREIARELGVTDVVEASVLKVGDSVRIQVQLIQASPNERQLWTHTYDRDVRAVLAMQSEVTRAIAREINVTLSAGESGHLAAAHEVDPLAYEDYLRGRRARQTSGRAALDAALGFFESAVRRDSNFALAHAAIAGIWSSRVRLSLLSSEDAFRMAEPSIRRALELDSAVSGVRLMLARIREWQWDWAAAEREYRSALQVDPNDADALDDYAHFLVGHGRPAEATAHIVRAVELDPLSATRQLSFGTVLALQRRFDSALEHYRAALRINPRLVGAHWNAAGAFHELRRFSESLREIRTYFDLSGDSVMVSTLDQSYALGGYPMAMRRAADLLAGRSRTAYVRPYWLVVFYSRAGETNLALDWLEQAVEERDPNMNNLRVLTPAAPFLNHPRYKALLAKMRLDRDVPR